MTMMQRPMEKRMMNREIILEERSSLTGIGIRTPRRRAVMRAENHRGGQISVFFSALQVGVPAARTLVCAAQVA